MDDNEVQCGFGFSFRMVFILLMVTLLILAALSAKAGTLV
jgi:hypothetical protein